MGNAGSEQRALEHQLRESHKLEAVGRLSGGIAHDFNNLLTVILGNVELLAEKLGHDRALREMAEDAAAAARRGAELTSQLLAFARRQPLEPRRLDTNRLVRGMRELLRRTVPEDIDIEILPDPDTWSIEVDRAQLESALFNLVTNARDAMPEGGMLTIQTANRILGGGYQDQYFVPPGEYVMIAVRDNGTGIAPVTAKRVFEPFFHDQGSREGQRARPQHGPRFRQAVPGPCRASFRTRERHCGPDVLPAQH